jgi:hypothetical protein
VAKPWPQRGAAKLPMITYSNDTAVADRDVFVLGQVPGQSIARVIGYARAQGREIDWRDHPHRRFRPAGEQCAGRGHARQGITLTDTETYAIAAILAASAVRRVKAKGRSMRC